MDENKEAKPLNQDSTAATSRRGSRGSASSDRSGRERRLYRQGSLGSQIGGSGIELASLGSRGNFSYGSRTPSGKSIRSRVATRAEYHDDLKPQLEQGYNRSLIFMSFIILMGTNYQFGYNIGVLNQPVDHIKNFYNITYSARRGNSSQVSADNGTTVVQGGGVDDFTLTFLWSLTTTLYVIGGMCGAYLAGFVANRVGRKKAVLISCIPAYIGALLCVFCQLAASPELLMIGRFVTGINCGMVSQLGPMYLLEIVPYNLKGAFGTACQLFCTIGIFMGGVFGLREILGTETLWPILLLLNALPALLCCMVLPFLPESPRYLMLVRKDFPAAEKALMFLRRTEDVYADIEEMETEMQTESDSNTKSAAAPEEAERLNANDGEVGKKHDDDKFTMSRLLRSRQLRIPLFIAMFLQVIQQLSGINAIFFYSKGIYDNAGVAAHAIQYAVVVTNAINMIMTIVAVPLMDRLGRRPLLLVPMVVMVLILALITIALKLQAVLGWMSFVSIGCVLGYVICFAVGLGPIPGMVGAELFRQGPRPFAMSLVGLTNWVFTAVVALSFEMIQKVTQEYTFIIFLVLMIGFTIFVYFFVPETKNKTFEEIASLWQPGDKIEVEELVDDPNYVDPAVQYNPRGSSSPDRSQMPNGGVGDSKAAVFSEDVFLQMSGAEQSDAKKAAAPAAVTS